MVPCSFCLSTQEAEAQGSLHLRTSAPSEFTTPGFKNKRRDARASGLRVGTSLPVDAAFWRSALCQPPYQKNYKKYNIFSVLQSSCHLPVLYLIVLYVCNFTCIASQNLGIYWVLFCSDILLEYQHWGQKLENCYRFQPASHLLKMPLRIGSSCEMH